VAAPLTQLVSVALEILLHSAGSVQGSLRVILVRDRRAKQCEDAVPRGLCHIALVAMNGVHHQFERRIDDRSRLLGVEVLHQIHRALDVREQCSDRLALAFGDFRSLGSDADAARRRG
jgi:hypothetical protein